MAPMFVRLMSKNGIIESPETSAELYCTLCDCGTSYESCQQHARSQTHREREKRFFRVFEISGNRAKCQICATLVDWRTAKKHAEHHTLIPWSEPPTNYDRYQIFFDNAIIQWNDVFRCCLCDDTFAIWDLALVHIANPEHQRLRDANHPPLDSHPSVIAATRESLVRECLILFNGSELRCTICENRSVPLGSVDRHIKGLVHLSCKSKFELPVKDCETVDSEATLFPQDWQSEEEQRKATDTACENVRSAEALFLEYFPIKMEQAKAIETVLQRPQRVKAIETVPQRLQQVKVIETVPQRPQQVKAIETVPQRPQQVKVRSIASDLDYILKEPGCTWYCIICDSPLKDRSVSNHATEKSHVLALKRYGCDAISFRGGVDYYCQYCDSPISSLDNVYQHVTGKKHQKSTKLAVALKARVTPQRISESVKASSNLDYILTRNDGTAWYCVICSCRLDERSIINHTTEKSHEIFFKRFGCGAVLTRDDDYYCRYCDSSFPSREKVYAHVVGKKHLISLISLNTGESKLALRLAQSRPVS